MAKSNNPLKSLLDNSNQNDSGLSDKVFLEASKGSTKPAETEYKLEEENLGLNNSQKRDLEYYRKKSDVEIVGKELTAIYAHKEIHVTLKAISTILGVSMVDLADNILLSFIEDYKTDINKIKNKKRGLL